MSESFLKKEKAKQKAKNKQEKAQRAKERKENNNKGKSLEDMFAYVDEYGNITSTPPDTSKKIEIALEDIQLGAAPIEPEETLRKGRVSFFNEEKGYGFINDEKTGESVFVHNNQLAQPVKEKDRVTFEKEKSERGFVAVNVQKISK